MYVAGDTITAVIDIGSETAKIGYSDTLLPMIFCPSISWKNEYISPVTRSVVSDVGSYLRILCDNAPRDAQSLVISENTMEAGGTKREILGYLMERRMCESVLFVRSGILDAFSYGKTTGVVVSLGGGSSQVCSVVDGLITCRRRLDVGGNDLTQDFRRGMEECGIDLRKFIGVNDGGSWCERKIEFEKNEFCRYVKEAVLSFRSEETDRRYEFPNGETVEMEDWCNRISKRLKEVVKLIVEVTELNAMEVRSTLSSNILVGGGCGEIRGMESFICEELGKERPRWKVKVNVERSRFSTFEGGSVIGSMGSAKSFHIGIKDYEEYGEGILDRKKCEWIVETV
ncbi:actin-like protein [Encephalitozoon intestinalis ATCC 50506]|uniref:Actin-like protein n=1 Tax=Encephalitozoon intestinalis (strain ATCC 50506) TaxID=876142 RepID=E0S6R1_ENCIT|nr:actin-like protein [Encephalitozoon intestinalis ATCC 50506]ADM11396.1 actin-like protein [Encephalitozoon intestinalis ATCC 50506]UTX45087.1 actin [Encephalitozoon intestinalis]